MAVLKPISASEHQALCSQPPAPDSIVVIFGASGDLAQTKILPALFGLFSRNLLGKKFYCIGCGRKSYDDLQFRDLVSSNIACDTPSDKAEFLERLFYISGDYSSQSLYTAVSAKVKLLSNDNADNLKKVFYLSLPPFIYRQVIENLGHSTCVSDRTSNIVIEKPFGRDLQSAVELNSVLSAYFDESQIYRIDHYLGKETVQNILMFRFANSIFEPLWNRNYIDHVQITISEAGGISGRGSYYDTSGAMRDMFQNHLLSMLSLVAMEPASGFAAEQIRNEKVKLLGSIRRPHLSAWATDIVFGQYSQGSVAGKNVCGYLQEKDVAENSDTETFVAARLFIDNWRWQGVPFYLRTGKRLANKLTEIAIVFKKVPFQMFASAGIENLSQNVLVLKIQPNEGISLFFEAKRPGSRLCMGTLEMDFDYEQVFSAHSPDAYQRLLLDCMTDDQTLFSRIDDVKLAWSLVDDVLQAKSGRAVEPFKYPAGSQSFSAADEIIERDGRKWRSI